MEQNLSKNKIQLRKPSISFNLQSMGDIYERASGQKDVPHRHDYYTIMLIQSAKGKHIVDYQTFLFSNYEIHFVSPGQIHIVDLEEKPQGWVLTFSRDFLLENNIPESFISNINLFRGFGDSPPLKIDEQIFDRLFGILREMETCMPLELKYRNRALGAFLQLFLIFSSNSQNLDATQLKEDHKGVCILRDFKQLVESNYDQWHKVKNYASEIHISPKHLSQTVKDITGKTAKTFIQDRILLESKRLLLHTELNINEVAYQVGFEEPLHFSSFFKKRVGDSPTKFRERLTP